MSTVLNGEFPPGAQLIFEVGADGKRTPVALTNGVTPGNSTVPGRAHGYTGDWSYTHVQRVRLV